MPWRGGKSAWKRSESCLGCRTCTCRRPTKRSWERERETRTMEGGKRTSCPPSDGACDTCVDPWCRTDRRRRVHASWKLAKPLRRHRRRRPRGPCTVANAAQKWERGGSRTDRKDAKGKPRPTRPHVEGVVRRVPPSPADDWAHEWANRILQRRRRVRPSLRDSIRRSMTWSEPIDTTASGSKGERTKSSAVGKSWPRKCTGTKGKRTSVGSAETIPNQRSSGRGNGNRIPKSPWPRSNACSAEEGSDLDSFRNESRPTQDGPCPSWGVRGPNAPGEKLVLRT